MTRKVLIVGFLASRCSTWWRFHVFAGASLALSAQGEKGYQPELASLDGQPVATGAGLTSARLPPDPPKTVDTLVLPGGRAPADRRDPRLIDWIRARRRRRA